MHTHALEPCAVPDASFSFEYVVDILQILLETQYGILLLVKYIHGDRTAGKCVMFGYIDEWLKRLGNTDKLKRSILGQILQMSYMFSEF
jgi:hypothetical protein